MAADITGQAGIRGKIVRALVRLAAAALTVVVLAGCNDPGGGQVRTGDQASGAGAVAPAPGAPTRVFSAEEAKGALLTVAELPTGWSAEPDDGATKNATQTYEQCPEFGAVTKRFNVTNAPDAGFRSPAGSEVSEALLSYPVAEAKTLVAEFSAATAKCPKLTDQTDEGISFDMHLTALSFPTLADETFAFRTTARLYGNTVHIDLVLVRRGGVIIAVSHTASGAIDTAMTEDVTRRALAKVEAVLR